MENELKYFIIKPTKTLCIENELPPESNFPADDILEITKIEAESIQAGTLSYNSETNTIDEIVIPEPEGV